MGTGLYIGHLSLKTSLTKIEVKSTMKISDPEVPTYDKTYWAKCNSNSIGLLFLTAFFNVCWSSICDRIHYSKSILDPLNNTTNRARIGNGKIDRNLVTQTLTT